MAGRSTTPGVRRRHGRGCAGGKRCECPYEAFVYDRRTGRKLRATFPSFDEARAWRDETATRLRKGQVRARRLPTLREAADQLVADMRAGIVRTRSDQAFRASFIAETEAAFAVVLAALGEGKRLDKVTRQDARRLVGQLRGEKGLSGSRVRNLLMGLRILYREHAEAVPVNPLAGLRIAPAGRRQRALGLEELEAYLAALEDDDECRLFYALAAHGLRAGEILGLEVDDVTAKEIHVRHAYNPKTGELVETKTRAGRRTVPVFGFGLEDALLAYTDRRGRAGDRPLFAPTTATYHNVKRRAETRFKAVGLEPATPHVFRHSFGSIALRGGVAPTTVAGWMGHGVETLLSVYAHAIGGTAMTAEVDRLARFLESAKAPA